MFFFPLNGYAQTIVDPYPLKSYTVTRNPFDLKYEIHTAIGVMPLDAFHKGISFSGSYTYHWNNAWAWEALHATYQMSFQTHLQKSLSEEYGMKATRNGGVPFDMLITSSGVFKPFFSKYAFVEKIKIPSESFISAGIGIAASSSKALPLFTLGIGSRFFISQRWSSRFDIKHHVVFSDVEVQNILLIQWGISFNPYPSNRQSVTPRGL